MGKNSKALHIARIDSMEDEARTVMQEMPGARIGLALQAIRQRLDQDLSVAIAAFEIDQMIDDKDHRIQRNPRDAYPEILAIKARLDACDGLIEHYQVEVAAEEAAKQAEIDEKIAAWEASNQIPEGAEILDVEPTEDGEAVVLMAEPVAEDATEEVVPETDPASSDE